MTKFIDFGSDASINWELRCLSLYDQAQQADGESSGRPRQGASASARAPYERPPSYQDVMSTLRKSQGPVVLVDPPWRILSMLLDACSDHESARVRVLLNKSLGNLLDDVLIWTHLLRRRCVRILLTLQQRGGRWAVLDRGLADDLEHLYPDLRPYVVPVSIKANRPVRQGGLGSPPRVLFVDDGDAERREIFERVRKAGESRFHFTHTKIQISPLGDISHENISDHDLILVPQCSRQQFSLDERLLDAVRLQIPPLTNNSVVTRDWLNRYPAFGFVSESAPQIASAVRGLDLAYFAERNGVMKNTLSTIAREKDVASATATYLEWLN